MDRHSDKVYKYTEYAGVLAACSSRMLTQPFDVLKVRLQLQIEPIKSADSSKYQSIFHSIRTIYKEERLRAFWKGHVPSQVSAVLHGFIQFGVYSRLSDAMKRTKTFENHPKLQNFLCGFLSGSAALTAVTPIDIVKTRLIAQDPGKGYGNLIDGLRLICKEEGFRGLYRGYIPSLIEYGPMVGGQFMFYNFFGDLLGYLFKQQNGQLPVYLLFAAGSLSGITMKVIVYPADLVKKRLQIQGFAENRKGFGQHVTCANMTSCFREIIRNEGLLGCYKGMTPAVLKSSITVATYFTFYDLFLTFLNQ
jgi:solute carrier family 25 thiamine pyrophosphate transporter 19